MNKRTRVGARLIARCEADYPKPLAEIADAPPLLYVRGHATLFEKPAVAIIGARNASAVGRKIARSLAEGLGAADIVVVSGLARGIDSAAHEASLKTGTIAVVAGGVDVIYPPEHAGLTPPSPTAAPSFRSARRAPSRPRAISRNAIG